MYAQVLIGLDDFAAGRWNDADRMAAEMVELDARRDCPPSRLAALYARALVTAARGDFHATQAALDELTWATSPRVLGDVDAFVHHVWALAAIGVGDFEDAYLHAYAVSRPGVLADHAPHAPLLLLDLVEAAVRTERRIEAHAHVAAVHDAAIESLSPRLALLARGAAAIAAADPDMVAAFEHALATPGADRFPFDLARVRLAYGERLRRKRRIMAARTQLRAALDTFEHLGARPWITRAAIELRAAGELRTPVSTTRSESLTPQEHVIAQLAATGLSNKQIGKRLLLSPRTISAHLYRVFPKLGIGSRAALRDALAGGLVAA
jgi:DNA-binding CsgD family transcriptional regulator